LTLQKWREEVMRVFIARGTDQFTSNEMCTESTYAAFYGFSLMG